MCCKNVCALLRDQEAQINPKYLNLLLQVYLVRFTVTQEHESYNSLNELSSGYSSEMLVAPKPLKLKAPKPISTPQMETTQYPTSVSISELLRAGQLTKPKLKNHVSLVLERYDVKFGTWNDVITLKLLVVCGYKFLWVIIQK